MYMYYVVINMYFNLILKSLNSYLFKNNKVKRVYILVFKFIIYFVFLL